MDQGQWEMRLQHLHGLNVPIPEAFKDDIDQVDAMAGLKDVDQSLEAYVHHVFGFIMTETFKNWQKGGLLRAVSEMASCKTNSEYFEFLPRLVMGCIADQSSDTNIVCVPQRNTSVDEFRSCAHHFITGVRNNGGGVLGYCKVWQCPSEPWLSIAFPGH